MEHRARPRDDLDWAEVPLVGRRAAAGEHRDRDPAGRDGRGERAVDRPLLLRRAVREVEAHAVVRDVDRDLERHRVVAHAVGVHLAAADVAPLRQSREPLLDQRLAVVVHGCDRLVEALEPVPLDHPNESGGAGAHADDRGVDVARDHLRHPRVRCRKAEDVRDQAASREQLDPWEDGAFLEHVDRVGGVRLLAADVEPVRLDRGVADEFALRQEHRHHHGRVLRVRAGAERVVVEDDVARFECRLAAHGVDRRRARRSSSCP